ncbi:MAG: [FeFe] hydrogenase, group A [Peptococcaceae bacterium]|jgi:NADP-reducing hydrogenase subunit HndD|nr:[FeFe] hydrogenase, group A [Peptococcaceae bacterium]
MDMVTVFIDDVEVKVPSDYTVLKAARKAGIKIPTLCYLKDVNQIGACRVCLVEIERARGLQASCVYPVSEGLKVYTHTQKVLSARKQVVELLLSNHPQECLTCSRSTNCELQTLAKDLGIGEVPFVGEKKEYSLDLSSPSIVRDASKCILCRRCVSVCNQIQEVGVLGLINRGFETTVGPAFKHGIGEVNCTNCGQCINVCPVGALKETDHTERVWKALGDPTKHVIVQTAPSVRAGLGEEFGLPMGTPVTGKMFAALRRLGFNKIFDTDFTADLTIMEEGYEVIERLTTGGKLPVITSCSPGWVKFCEHTFPELLENLSSAKSPQSMFGALAKTYYPETAGVDPASIYSVSIMPCTAKKFECQRPEMAQAGTPDVDAVLTTRELGAMIRQAGIDFINLPDEEADAPMGIGTGAGDIFGATGGVMEAAIRTVYEVVGGKPLPDLELAPIRGMEGIKEAALEVPNFGEVRVAVAHGLSNAAKLMEIVKEGKKQYHFIEIMACPGGCVGGGGQPLVTSAQRIALDDDYQAIRREAVYAEDRGKALRKSHDNPAIKEVYDKYLGKPLGEKSHHLLHTHYTARGKYNVAIPDVEETAAAK